MERVACQNYPGMIRDLQKLEDFLASIIQKIHDGNPGQFNHIYYALRMIVNGYEPRIPIPANIQKDWETVKEMAKEAWETDDEEETYQIAQKVAAYLKKRYEEEKAKEEESEDKEEDLKEQLKALEDLKDALENSEEGEGEEEEDDTPQSVQMPWEEKKKKGISIEMSDGEDGEGEDSGEGEEGEGSEGDEDSEDKDDSKGKSSDKEEENEEEGEGSGEGDEEDDSEDGDEDEKGKSKGKSKDKSEDDSEDGEGESDSDEGEDGESESDSEEGEEDSDEDGKDEEKGESKEDRMDKLEKEIEEKKKEIADALKEKIKAQMGKDSLDPNTAKDIDPTKEYEVEHKDDDTGGRGGVVVPLPLHDYVKKVEVEAPKHSVTTKRILDTCMGSVCGMAQRFIQKVRSRVHVGVRTYKGRVNRRRLHRYKFDNNIFKTQNLRKKKDASVMIIVDCSGSMGGSKIDTARKAALVIGEMMSRAKVEFEIRGFTIPFSSEYRLGCFTRQADLVHYRFGGSKDWHHTQHNVVDGQIDAYGLQDNDDGESLRHFADELSHSKKDAKMMVVISDGAPACGAQMGNTTNDLKQVIPEIRDAGIDIYAIGLDTDVAKFYGADKSVRLASRADTTELIEAIGKFVTLIAVD